MRRDARKIERIRIAFEIDSQLLEFVGVVEGRCLWKALRLVSFGATLRRRLPNGVKNLLLIVCVLYSR